jgi:hypothetical protein
MGDSSERHSSYRGCGMRINSFKSKVHGVLAVSTAALVLAGCGGQIPCAGLVQTEVDTQSPVNGTINVSIDGSGSMKGFSAVSDSTFHKTIEEIDTLLGVDSALGFTKSKTVVRRIGLEGSPSMKMSNIPIASVLAARTPDFFEERKGSWPKVSSTIEQFVNKDPGSVDILISDLEPDNASIKQLLSAIKPKLQFRGEQRGWLTSRGSTYAGNQLALIGIQSQFDGGVFPAVQGSFQSFPYRGKRPFYILAIGPSSKVEKIVERLVQDQKIAPHLQVSRFASNPNNGTTAFINATKANLQPSNCFSPVFAISQGLSGKLKVQDPGSPSRWMLAQKVRGCNAQQIEVSFATTQMMGFGGTEINDSSTLTVKNADIQKGSITMNGMSGTVQVPVLSGVISLLDISADASKLDQIRWADWNTSGTKMEGDKTQRLLALIKSIREETDQYALTKFGQRYSPARVCAAVKG